MPSKPPFLKFTRKFSITVSFYDRISILAFSFTNLNTFYRFYNKKMQCITFLIYNKRLLLFVLLGALSGGARRRSILIFPLTFFYEPRFFGSRLYAGNLFLLITPVLILTPGCRYKYFFLTSIMHWNWIELGSLLVLGQGCVNTWR